MAVADNALLKGGEGQPLSPVLRRELGIADLAFAQILLVIVPEFFGTAVKAGPSHVVLWLAAILLFFIPLALLVAHLNRLLPLEGGLYEWARHAFGDWMGFMVAWNLWLTSTVQVSQIALVTTTYFTYALGPKADWIASNSLLQVAASLALIAGMMFIARLGLKVGKWVCNAGSIFTVIILGVLIALPFFHAWKGTMPHYHPLPLVAPPLTLFSLTVFSKMTFGALSGFELIAIFAGESRNPGRNLARSILFTAPLIALLYILGTSSILAFVSPNAIDVIGPIPQALRRGLEIFSVAGPLASIAIFLLLFNYLCSYTLYFSSNTRLPMVAGWDHLLPNWFAVLHARYRTPVNSILFMGGVSLAASTAVLVGAGNQEAFSLLQIWAWTFYGLSYLVLFAIPLVSSKQKGLRPGLWLRAGAGTALLVTLLFVLLSVQPVIQVASRAGYFLKVALVIVGANLVGWAIYGSGQAKRAA